MVIIPHWGTVIETDITLKFYNMVQVVRVDFSTQDWSKSDARYTVAIEAAIDNDSHDDNVPLAPWS